MMTTAKSVQTTALRLQEAESSIVARRLIQTLAIAGHRLGVTVARFQMTVVDPENHAIATEMMTNRVVHGVMIEETTHGVSVAMSGVVHVPTIVDENFEHLGVMI